MVEDLGLKASERISPANGSSKSNEPNDDYECDVCHSILYISMVCGILYYNNSEYIGELYNTFKTDFSICLPSTNKIENNYN